MGKMNKYTVRGGNAPFFVSNASLLDLTKCDKLCIIFEMRRNASTAHKTKNITVKNGENNAIRTL